jgi:N-acyl-D-aspartate/D-glutamate deacylase
MDLILRNSTIYDGTGSAPYNGDIGVRDGVIIAIGRIDVDAKEEIDVSGAAVAPGFIDCHTHYDAQVMWDSMLSPSVYHGVTTVLAGHCGFTVAPLSGRKADADYLLAMLSRVEGMPLASLEAAVKPTWMSFGEYLDSIDGKVAINIAFSVGHSALRRYVMGDRAVGHQATTAELDSMKDLLRQSLAEGGTGFSTSIGNSHLDHNGDPVPSRWATDEELISLAGVLRDFPGTWLEIQPSTGGMYGERQYKLVTDMSLAAQRSLNWNLLLVDSLHREFMEKQMVMGPYAAERGARVYGLVPAVPIKGFVNLQPDSGLAVIDGWNEFLHLPHDEKIAAMHDPLLRMKLQEGIDRLPDGTGLSRDFGSFLIADVRTEGNARLKGRFVSDYAAELGLRPLEAIFKLAVEEDLRLSLSPPAIGGDEESWSMRGRAWQDEHCLIGGSDAGAHLTSINTFALTTQLLGEGVRVRRLLTLEDAIRRITSVPADVFGLKDRGRLKVGAKADVVVFDPETIGCAPIEMRDDLPQGEMRLYADSIGINHVIVNGIPVASNNKPTGRKGGKVLRSGRDTFTVPLN